VSQTTLLNGLLEPVGQCLDEESARRLVALKPSAEVEDRIAALAARANEGELTDAERTEYEAVVNAMDIVSILKLKARRRLRHMTA
jgi:hypothetical protein